MKANPSFQFYPSDWLRDPGLRSCSLAARGLWIDMLAFMHEAEPYGHLRLNDKDIAPAGLSRMVGTALKATNILLHELEAAGVFSRTDQGTIFSRRMVRDQALRVKRGQYGHLSAGHPAVPQKKDLPKDTIKVSLPPPIDGSIGGSPSSSSSVFSLQSSSLKEEKKESKSAGSAHTVHALHAASEESFKRFWTEYPNKKHKGAAEQWFATHHPAPALVEQMVTKLTELKATEAWREDKGKWVPLPGNWLNDKCWEDQVRVDVPPPPRRLIT